MRNSILNSFKNLYDNISRTSFIQHNTFKDLLRTPGPSFFLVLAIFSALKLIVTLVDFHQARKAELLDSEIKRNLVYDIFRFALTSAAWILTITTGIIVGASLLVAACALDTIRNGTYLINRAIAYTSAESEEQRKKFFKEIKVWLASLVISALITGGVIFSVLLPHVSTPLLTIASTIVLPGVTAAGLSAIITGGLGLLSVIMHFYFLRENIGSTGKDKEGLVIFNNLSSSDEGEYNKNWQNVTAIKEVSHGWPVKKNLNTATAPLIEETPEKVEAINRKSNTTPTISPETPSGEEIIKSSSAQTGVAGSTTSREIKEEKNQPPIHEEPEPQIKRSASLNTLPDAMFNKKEKQPLLSEEPKPQMKRNASFIA